MSDQTNLNLSLVHLSKALERDKANPEPHTVPVPFSLAIIAPTVNATDSLLETVVKG